MRIAYLGAHSILEYDELRMLTGLGHEVFSIGAYINPHEPLEDKRPGIPEMTYHPEMAEACADQMLAKHDLPDVVMEWADTIIVAAYPGPWIAVPWSHIRGKRVIWRTIGQSGPDTEEMMAPFHRMGLEIVRYSPKERIAFEKLGVFAGETAMIRFAKDPSDYGPWIGDDPVVGNVTQDMLARGEFTNLRWYQAATEGLPTRPAGPGSDKLPGGIGILDYDTMRAYLASVRTYCYTGTQPASYTLGLMEAMLTGVPVVSIGPERMWLPDLFEGHELALYSAEDAAVAHRMLSSLLERPDQAASQWHRANAIKLFGIDAIAPQWADLLGAKVPVPA